MHLTARPSGDRNGKSSSTTVAALGVEVECHCSRLERGDSALHREDRAVDQGRGGREQGGPGGGVRGVARVRRAAAGSGLPRRCGSPTPISCRRDRPPRRRVLGTAPVSSATRCSGSGRRPSTTTSCPPGRSSRAVAAPIPVPPPVNTTTRLSVPAVGSLINREQACVISRSQLTRCAARSSQCSTSLGVWCLMAQSTMRRLI